MGKNFPDEEHFCLLITNISDVVCLFNPDGDIRFLSPSIEKAIGYFPEERVGKNIFRSPIVHPDDMGELRGMLEQSVANPEKIIKTEFRIKHKNGSFIAVEAIAQNLLNNPRINGIVAVYRNITESKKMEAKIKEERDRVRNYIDVAGVMLVVIGSDLKVQLINKKGAEILGYEEEEIVGKNWFNNFLPKTTGQQVKYKFKNLLKGNLEQMEYYENPVVTRDGEERLIAWNNTFLKDGNGNIIAILSSGEDITERREMEFRKDDFIALASHELKTPVTSLKMFVQVLEKNINHLDASATSGMLSTMDKQIDKLTEIVNGLLDVSRVQQGKLEYERKELPMGELIKETVQSVQRINKTHKIQIDSQTNTKVMVDKSRIGQVLTNLINNAIKYSPNADKIIVSSKKVYGNVIVSVQDFGIGIPKNQQLKVFDRFYQVDNPRAKTNPGLGLGLYISKEIITKHGGELWLESKEGKGSTFYFSLPV